MKRKLIKQGGGGGLTLYLPKKWVDKNHLMGGDEVNVEEENNRIVIDTEAKQKHVKQEIEIKEHSSEFISRIITNSYKKGVDELKIIFNTKPPLDTVNKTLSALTIGYEVTDVGNNYCTISSFSLEDEEKIETVIRKCFFLIKDIQTTIQEDIKLKKFRNLDNIKSMNKNIRRLINYAIRTTIKTTKNPNEIQYNSIIFSNIYLFSIKLVYIYVFLEKEKTITKNTSNILDNLFMMFNKFYDAYYKKDFKIINDVLELKKKITNELNNSVEKTNGKIILQASMAMRCVHDPIGALIGLITG
ncbi:AbrB/MazE/SpoVT family DNA-binding domain-containing protein [Candidatus Woesearchaeota archaeon]|jgi:phosphate uptake regulator|nr:AbrB/MazE/SpoVT family DNA-binding domain-containing protein [Candidatus Woesearchaeota archaeon]